VSSPSGFNLSSAGGSLMARGASGATWRIEHDGRRVRAVRPDGVPTVWAEGSIRAQPVGSALLSLDGSPFRGEFTFAGSDSGLAEINTLSIEDYLPGVVPLEMGDRPPGDSAAAQAQAVTARSYAYIHLTPSRPFDVTAGVLDQLYGGVAAETAVGSQAVESTRWLVLTFGGRVVNAPYHSACGGSTAAASEIWRTSDEPYLRAVSDRIPGTDRFYCDGAPRFTWTRTFDAATLNAAIAQYLAAYVNLAGKRPGVVEAVSVASHTPSGRVGTLTVTTDRGNFVLRGNDIRFVLRKPGGEILESTYFSVATAPAPDGSLARLTLHGMGYGHGVGMCQWGAIGRARAGQDFREILRAYYPGTAVGPAP
jgi:stage II sporulation protein D